MIVYFCFSVFIRLSSARLVSMISTMLIQLELPFIGSDLIISEKKKLYYVV